MLKTQEIKDPARMEKLTKELRKSRISMGDGKTIGRLGKETHLSQNSPQELGGSGYQY
jgi:hypothetical protein